MSARKNELIEAMVGLNVEKAENNKELQPISNSEIKNELPKINNTQELKEIPKIENFQERVLSTEDKKLSRTEKYRKFQTTVSIPPDVKENGIILAQMNKTSFTQLIIDLIEKETYLNKDKIRKFKDLIK